jgi:tetratricopeptide (TPR) repeat protein
MHMEKNQKITLLAAGLLFVALSGTSPAQDKKPAAGGGATEHANKGVQLSQAGAFDAAIVEFSEAIKANPKDYRLYNDRGGVYLTMKKFQDAVTDFTKAIELSPKDHAAYSTRGAALNELNQIDPAMADLNKALELKAGDPQTLERRGLVFYKQKKYQEALTDYDAALQQNPSSSLGLSRRADAYVALNQFDKAQTDLQAALAIRPDDFNAQDRLRYVQAKLAPPPPPRETAAAAAPVAKPTPKPKLLTRANIFIGIGALFALLIVGVIVGKVLNTRSSD